MNSPDLLLPDRTDRPTERTTMSAPSTPLQRLVAEARYEVVPMKNLEPQLPHLPEGCTVSVTCSPTKGQQTTLDLTAVCLK